MASRNAGFAGCGILALGLRYGQQERIDNQVHDSLPTKDQTHEVRCRRDLKKLYVHLVRFFVQESWQSSEPPPSADVRLPPG